MKISLSKLKTTTLSALAERIVVASKSGKYTLSVSQHPLLNALEMEKNNYKLLLNKQVYSGKGQKVAELDEARDKSYNAMKIYLKSYIGMPTLPNYEDAVALYDVFKQNNLNLDKKSYADQSVLLDKLIADLDKTENKERLTRLNLAAAFADLKTKQETFSHLISEQTEANAELRLTKSASAVRKDLESVIRNYLGFITAMKSQPDWSALYTEMSEVVKEIRNS